MDNKSILLCLILGILVAYFLIIRYKPNNSENFDTSIEKINDSIKDNYKNIIKNIKTEKQKNFETFKKEVTEHDKQQKNTTKSPVKEKFKSSGFKTPDVPALTHDQIQGVIDNLTNLEQQCDAFRENERKRELKIEEQMTNRIKDKLDLEDSKIEALENLVERFREQFQLNNITNNKCISEAMKDIDKEYTNVKENTDLYKNYTNMDVKLPKNVKENLKNKLNGSKKSKKCKGNLDDMSAKELKETCGIDPETLKDNIKLIKRDFA